MRRKRYTYRIYVYDKGARDLFTVLDLKKKINLSPGL